jgi:glycosyltransferase involved in cell wall biosynthesis
LGDGPERQALEDLAAQLGIDEQVTFMGEVPFEEVPAYLKAADFFGFASTTETQGLVTMEALAAHLPVIAVEASGTRDIIQHEKQGLLVAEDQQALARGIDQLLSNERLYQRFQNAAQSRAQKFEMKALASSLIEVYRQAIQYKERGHFVQVE